MKLARIGEPQISPDGRTVAFTVQTIDVSANRRPRQIWVVPVAGGAPRQITWDGENNERPRWLARFQAHRLRLRPRRLLADLAHGRRRRQSAAGHQPVHRSRRRPGLARRQEPRLHQRGLPGVRRRRRLQQEDSSTKRRTARSKRASTPRCSTATGRTGRPTRRSHILAVPVAGGAARDLTPGDRDVPPFSLGGPDDYAISPDGGEVCYTMNADPVPAISTNSDLFVVPIAGGQGPPARSPPTPAPTADPLYSPDGKYLAWRTQIRAGIRERPLAPGGDGARHRQASPSSPRAWTAGSPASPGRPDSSKLFFTTEDRGRQAIQFISVTGGEIAHRRLRRQPPRRHAVHPRRQDHDLHAAERQRQPAEIYRASAAGGAAAALTHLNDAVLERQRAHRRSRSSRWKARKAPACRASW